MAGQDVDARATEAERQRTRTRAERARAQRQIERQITSRLPRVPLREGYHGGLRAWRWLLRKRLIANYLRDDGDGLATIIAFNALFSLLPFLLILFTTLSLFVKSAGAHQQIQQWVADALPPSAADPAMKIVEGGRDNLGEVTVVTGISLLVSGARFFGALDRAFATIYRIPRRPFLERKALALVMAPIVSLVMVGAAVASTIVSLLVSFADRIFPVAVGTWITAGLSLLVSFATAFGMAWFVYTVVPQRRRHMRAWPGAALAAVLLALLNQGFPLYLRLSGGGGSVYGGAFALILVLMFWLYLLGQIIVVGAEVNAMMSGRKEEAERTHPPLASS